MSNEVLVSLSSSLFPLFNRESFVVLMHPSSRIPDSTNGFTQDIQTNRNISLTRTLPPGVKILMQHYFS